MVNIPHATKPTADIHVVFPRNIAFDVLPGHRWILEVGREYIIMVDLLECGNHKIIITENVLLETVLPNEYFEIYHSSPNGSYHLVRAIKQGITSLHSSLTQLKHPITGDLHPLPKPLTRPQPVEIYHPLRVIPSILVIPYDNEHQYKHRLKVEGGSGSYQWTSDNVDVVGVSNIGQVTSFNKGKANVTVSDVKNDYHYDTAKVYVVPPHSMSFLSTQVEVELGGHLLLPLQVIGKTTDLPPAFLPFYDCRLLNLKLLLADKDIFNVSVATDTNVGSLPEGACVLINASSLKPGHTHLVVTYESGLIHLEASITISSYLPLRAVDPPTIAVVTLGSSKGVVFEGGPLAWVLDQSRYYKTLVPEYPDNVQIIFVPSSSLSLHTYTVVCRKLGRQELTFTVGNGPTEKNRIPANESVSIILSCSLPSSVIIRPVVKEMTKCPLLNEGNQDIQFPVLTHLPLSLEVKVFDKNHLQFDNFSSLHWAWSSSDHTLLSLQTSQLHHYGHRAVLSTQVSGQPGSVTVSATTNSHITDILVLHKIIEYSDPFSPPVSVSLSLLLQHEPILFPPSLLLYHHPSNMGSISILHGSSYFSVDHVTKPRPPVADIIYIKESHQININPLGEGDIHLYVHDLCLPIEPITGAVHISTIHSIQVTVPDKVQVGSSVVAHVRVLNDRAKAFPSNQHKLMKLLPNPKTDHISVKVGSKPLISKLPPNVTIDSSIYVIEGLSIGIGVIIFNATMLTGKVISSPPIEIQVYDALSLMPKVITLVPTAVFQIHSSGGPHHQTSVSYAIDNNSIATVSSTGLITAISPGTATVTGQALSSDNPPVMYSSDTVIVHVIRLTGIKIIVPSTKLVTDEEISVYAEGVGEGETPFSFGTAAPPLSFTWEVYNMDVISLVSVYDKAGISIQDEKDFATRLLTRNPGRGSVKVIVKCPPKACTTDVLMDEVQLSIFAKLTLITPSDHHFLLPQNGLAKIITNRDGSCHITYNLITSSCPGDSTHPLVSVSPNGMVFTAGYNGHAAILVTSHETELQLNQSIIIHVEVRPLYSLSISCLSSVIACPNSKQHSFPLGYSAPFTANLHDSIGRQFDHGGTELSYRLSRFDIVHVSRGGHSNSSYVIKGAKVGTVILKVWVKEFPSISDYIRISVSYAIQPYLATVHVGSKICFTTHLTEGHSGSWETATESILSLDTVTGVAKAVTTGRAVIYHKINDMTGTHTEISVATVQRVVFNLASVSSTSMPPLFTNSPVKINPSLYRIPVEFKDEHNSSDFTLLQAAQGGNCIEDYNDSMDGPVYLQQVHFDCILQLTSSGISLPTSQFIAASPIFDKSTGMSYCVLDTAGDDGVGRTLSTMEDLVLHLKVRASDFDENYEVWSAPLPIPFVPAFHSDASQVLLTSEQSTVKITLSGHRSVLESIQAHSPHPFSIECQPIKDHSSSVYAVSIDSKYPSNVTDLYITFTSSYINQQLTLPLSYIIFPKLDSSSCPANDTNSTSSVMINLSNQWNVIFLVVTAIITLLAILVACIALRQTSSGAVPGFRANLPQSPVGSTPLRSAPHQGVSPPPPPSQSTPLWSSQATPNQPVFRRTTNFSQYSPTRSSPQNNMFTQ
jgi:nuclear pore complex protein Nup210